MEAGQRSVVRHGLPRAAAGAAPGGRDRTPGGSLRGRNPFVERERPTPVLIDTTRVIAHLNELRPLEVQQVRRIGDEPLFNSLIEHHHYLGYEQPVGEHLKYLMWTQGRPIACMAWSSPRTIWAALTATSAGAWKPASETSGSSPKTL